MNHQKEKRQRQRQRKRINRALKKREQLSSRDSPEEVDRLSDLPDCLIHHILSFLPATRDAIRTGLLSKRWRNQWRQVPVLSFPYFWQNRGRHIDNVLNQHECSKLEKFCISVKLTGLLIDPCIDQKIKFSLSRDVKELILEFNLHVRIGFVRLPEYLFSHTWLVKLQLHGCSLPVLNVKVNWQHLKELSASDCDIPDRTIENILSGSPVLELLNLGHCAFHHAVIASKSLRKFQMAQFGVFHLEISCPNIEELHIRDSCGCEFCNGITSSENNRKPALCDTLQLTSKGEFSVTSTSLKKLVLETLDIGDLEISCPKLEELQLLGELHTETAKAVNLQSVVSVTLDCGYVYPSPIIKEILVQLQHVEKLKFGRRYLWFREVERGCWRSNPGAFCCPLRNLLVVQIDGLWETKVSHNGPLNYVEFLLKRAPMLEKLTLILENIGEYCFLGVLQKISRLQRCSEKATVELMLYRQNKGWVKKVIPKGVIL